MSLSISEQSAQLVAITGGFFLSIGADELPSPPSSLNICGYLRSAENIISTRCKRTRFASITSTPLSKSSRHSKAETAMKDDAPATESGGHYQRSRSVVYLCRWRIDPGPLRLLPAAGLSAPSARMNSGGRFCDGGVESEIATKNPRAAPEGDGSVNIPIAVIRSCWRWRLGPNVPGVGRWFSRKGTCGGAVGVSISQAHKVSCTGECCSLARLNDPPTVR